MKVTVRHFAALRERRGVSLEQVDLPEGTTVDEAYAALFPGVAMRVAYAVNAATVPAGTVLRPDDEVAFLPPLGGG